MTGMIDRVAKAMVAKAVERGFAPVPPPILHHLAAAAIEAMREPTIEMMDALDDGDEDQGLEHGWRMAIDAALAEP